MLNEKKNKMNGLKFLTDYLAKISLCTYIAKVQWKKFFGFL